MRHPDHACPPRRRSAAGLGAVRAAGRRLRRARRASSRCQAAGAHDLPRPDDGLDLHGEDRRRRADRRDAGGGAGGSGAALADVVARMSHYDADSELSRFNRQPLGAALRACRRRRCRCSRLAQAVQRRLRRRLRRGRRPRGRRLGLRPASRPRAVLPASAVQALQRPAARRRARSSTPRAGTLTRHAAGAGQPVGHRQGLRRRPRGARARAPGHGRLHGRGRRRDPHPRPQRARAGPGSSPSSAPTPCRSARCARAARRHVAGHFGRLPQLLRARGPALFARDRPRQRRAGAPCPGLGQRGGRRLHACRRLVDRAVRARARARPGAGQAQGLAAHFVVRRPTALQRMATAAFAALGGTPRAEPSHRMNLDTFCPSSCSRWRRSASRVAAMAVGVMFKRPCLRGSCGGPACSGPMAKAVLRDLPEPQAPWVRAFQLA